MDEPGALHPPWLAVTSCAFEQDCPRHEGRCVLYSLCFGWSRVVATASCCATDRLWLRGR
jgi:hypothetical protein